MVGPAFEPNKPPPSVLEEVAGAPKIPRDGLLDVSLLEVMLLEVKPAKPPVVPATEILLVGVLVEPNKPDNGALDVWLS